MRKSAQGEVDGLVNSILYLDSRSGDVAALAESLRAAFFTHVHGYPSVDDTQALLSVTPVDEFWRELAVGLMQAATEHDDRAR